jgi:hypothetical protein
MLFPPKEEKKEQDDLLSEVDVDDMLFDNNEKP